MTDNSKWERLSEAVDRVARSTGVSSEQTRIEICRALADWSTAIRGKLGRNESGTQTSSDTVLEGEHFHLPSHLEPHHLDWDASRPLGPWPIRDVPRIRGRWYLEWLELSKADVTAALFGPKNHIAVPQSEPRAKRTRQKRATPKLDAAKRALKALYSNPKQYPLLNDDLCAEVAKYVEQRESLVISRDTVLRAAGLRPKSKQSNAVVASRLRAFHPYPISPARDLASRQVLKG
jgi:hypothetical protein